MQLLVSVRNAAEAAAALAGGADIIDAKEPRNGPLGSVSSQELRAIVAGVGSVASVSAALGDASDQNVESRMLRARDAGAAYLKVGFAGIRASDLEGHIRRLARIVDPAPLVLVAYADFEVAAAPEPLNVVLIAETVAIAGILLDTYDKEGPGLTSLMNAHALASFVNRSKKLGRMVALAGQLTFEDIDTVCDAGADVIGIRGTACEGGRSGIVAAHRVREFRNQLDRRAVAAGTAAFRAI